jgi:phenylacetate-CoA ligase
MLERLALYFEPKMRNTSVDPEKLHRFLSSKVVKRYLKKYVFLKLKQSITYAYTTSPFYHELFQKSSLHPSDIKTFQDMQKIPLTSAADILNPERFFSVPASKFVKIFSSSGMTGKPKQIFFTKRDIDQLISRNASGFRLFYGLGKGDRLRISFDIGYRENDWGIRYCLENVALYLGAMGVVTAHRLSAKDEYQLLIAYGVTMIIGTPSYLLNLTCDLEKNYDLRALHLKALLVGAEPLPQGVRKKLEAAWGTKVYQGYGLIEVGTSVAAECRQQDGMHITETDVYLEVINPQTGEILKDGKVGEIVCTTLGREGMPLLRYRTRDLGCILTENCPCGLPLRRIKIKGRTDDILVLGSGDKLAPSVVDEVLLSLPSVCDYQLVLTRRKGKDHLTVFAQTTSQAPSMKQKIVNALMTLPEISHGVHETKTIQNPEVKLVKPHTFAPSSIKAKRIIDKRRLYE